MCSGWRGAPFSCMPPQGGASRVYPSISAIHVSHKDPSSYLCCDEHLQHLISTCTAAHCNQVSSGPMPVSVHSVVVQKHYEAPLDINRLTLEHEAWAGSRHGSGTCWGIDGTKGAWHSGPTIALCQASNTGKDRSVRKSINNVMTRSEMH